MEANRTYHTPAMLVSAAAILLVLFCVSNGLWMLAVPLQWYWAVPGVPLTGGYNQHFIRDIGIIYVMTGLAVLVGLVRPVHRRLLWGAASAWLTSHAIFHLVEVAAGICGKGAIPRDFAGVTLPGLIALGLALSSVKYSQRSVTSAVAASS